VGRDIMIKTKVCPKCYNRFEHTLEHFHSDASKPTGLNSWCKKCANIKNSERTREKAREKAEANGRVFIRKGKEIMKDGEGNLSRLCRGCGEQKPLTHKHFYYSAKSPGGYSATCCSCTKKKAQSVYFAKHGITMEDGAKLKAKETVLRNKQKTWSVLLCGCGCGVALKSPTAKYIYGHQHLGKKHSAETIKKISESGKGEKNSMYGKPPSEEGRINVSCRMQGIERKEWGGFIKGKGYCGAFSDNEFKDDMRTHYKNTCQGVDCKNGGINPSEKALHLHHIDYDKQNCNPDNLIPLCMSCHAKTNGNRVYWKRIYQEVVARGVTGGKSTQPTGQ